MGHEPPRHPKSLAATVPLITDAKADDWRGGSEPILPKVRRSKQPSLLDHLVGALQEQCGDRQSDRLGGLEIDDEFELRRLFDRQFGRLCTF